MKKVSFIFALSLAFSIVSFGQSNSCQNAAEMVDSYGNSEPGSHKERMDFLRVELANNPNCVGTIRFQSMKKENIFRQINKIYRGFQFMGIPLENIAFAINPKSKEENVEFWMKLPNAEIPNCEECIIIRAKDFSKIQELFKPITKKRKN